MRPMPSMSRELYLPRELVFDAWTRREHLAEWYAPEECLIREVVVEPVVGGPFVITWTDVSGAIVRESGLFTEMTPPAGFVCAMGETDRGAAAGAWRLRLELSDLVDACRIVLRQEGMPEQSGLELQQSRQEAFANQWGRRLDRLEAYFSVI